MKILVNDVFVNNDEAVFEVQNRAFKYGDALFESMRMTGGKIQFASEHAERLQAGMNALKMEGAKLFDAYFLNQKAAELCRKNKFGKEVRFRLSIYRDGAGLYTPESNKVGYALEAVELKEKAYLFNSKGIILDLYTEIKKPINILSNYKTTNALLYVLAGLFKKQNQLDEAVILNHEGFLCESISSNIFIVYKKQIYTPALSEGCVAGVMRDVVMKLAENLGMTINEAQINPQILAQADEIFLTNATSGIRWVVGYAKKRYFYETSKFLSDKLNEQVKMGLL
ncbi:MAG: aminotransferase class IV [Sphingobacteriaceae bacterium]|nr:aminotransferase class IV [Sphingobacteriaceae bacterium]